MTYSPSRNLAKGTGAAFGAASAIGGYAGLVATVQWLASLYSLDIPDTVANFLCGAAVAGVAWMYGRVRNWRKHGWKR
jgi:nitrate/nitrite transporter NarK